MCQGVGTIWRAQGRFSPALGMGWRKAGDLPKPTLHKAAVSYFPVKPPSHQGGDPLAELGVHGDIGEARSLLAKEGKCPSKSCHVNLGKQTFRSRNLAHVMLFFAFKPRITWISPCVRHTAAFAPNILLLKESATCFLLKKSLFFIQDYKKKKQ